MAGKNTGDCEYGFPIYGGAHIGDMEYGSVPVIGETAAGLIRNLSGNVAGIWKTAVEMLANVSGIWKPVDVLANIGGVWTLIHEK